MEWIVNLFSQTDSIAHIVLLYSTVIACGVLLGKIKIGGISLGVTFVLFAGILAGHIKFTAPLTILNFLQDFGLILFVFCIGLQVGPGFFESFRKGGVRLNMLAIAIVLLNIAVMFGCYFAFFNDGDINDLPMLVGTLYGAVTNTPGLGAANETLSSMTSVFTEGMPQIASGYACAYPLGVLGIIGGLILIRHLTKTKLEEEEKKLRAEDEENAQAKPYQMHIKVRNSFLAGRNLKQIAEFLNRDMVCSRMIHDGELLIPNGKTVIELGDEMLIECPEADAEAIQAFIGPETGAPWPEDPVEQPIVSQRVIVTRPSMNGKTLGKMHFSSVFGVTVTRITRQGMDLFASRNYRFQVGDKLLVVGPKDKVEHVANVMGNSARRLNTPNIATIFIGIVIGIVFGSLPFAIPGIPVPLKLGLAGGPLIVAILIGRFGYRLKLVTYTTTSANMMLREIGLVLFLASVGIKAGDGFWQTVIAGDGIKYVYSGFLITIIPIIIIGLVGRLHYKLNYFTLIGMISGSYTDPPALAYSNSICSREAPAIGYSTVYPLTMFLRIFTAQIIILFCVGM